MKNSRLFQMLYLLVERRSLTAGELAERFEVSQRTIYRDIDALSAAGIPVYAQPGQGGGIRLMDQFVLDRALLSPEQQDEVLFALQAVLAAGGAGEEETLSRLSALFRREGGDWLEVDFTDWGSAGREKENFRLAKRAILGRRVLAFTYYSSSGQRTRRQAEPARLVFKGGCWYLRAFCRTRRDWRVFRLGRMEEPVLEQERFPPRLPPQSLEEPSGASPVPLKLLFRPGAAYRVRDYFHPAQVTALEDGRLLVECAFPGDGWLLGFLLSFGEQLEVLSPGCWRAQVEREAKKIVGVYQTGQNMSGLMGYPLDRRGRQGPDNKGGTIMEERKFCQSCGMPLDRPEDCGTEKDGAPSRDYCRYCYQNGAFTAPDADMEGMIAFNLKFNEENGFPFGAREEAERNMRAWFPTLKRWKK